MQSKKNKIGIVVSPGGHLWVALQLQSWWKKHDRFWMTDVKKIKKMKLLVGEKKYDLAFPEQRNVISFVKNFWFAFSILNKERPTILFSCGAGVAVPFFIWAKVFRIQTIFIEPFLITDQPTLTGKLIYHLSDLFLIQQVSLKKFYPDAICLPWKKIFQKV